MRNEVVEFLLKEAKNNDFNTFDSVSGDLCLTEDKSIKQSCGAVYGIFVESATPPSTSLSPFKDYPNLCDSSFMNCKYWSLSWSL